MVDDFERSSDGIVRLIRSVGVRDEDIQQGVLTLDIIVCRIYATRPKETPVATGRHVSGVQEAASVGGRKPAGGTAGIGAHGQVRSPL